MLDLPVQIATIVAAIAAVMAVVIMHQKQND